ncbi:MAG TPA: dihydroorotate dehydrogenase, partial [Synergistales bacterium]|nr:dihydroorotate dehydrogenase [Synergistales bacterium]
GGIARPGDALSMILAGASAVEVGTALFIDSGLPASICRELEANLTKKGLASVRELVGRARNDQGENGEKSR